MVSNPQLLSVMFSCSGERSHHHYCFNVLLLTIEYRLVSWTCVGVAYAWAIWFIALCLGYMDDFIKLQERLDYLLIVVSVCCAVLPSRRRGRPVLHSPSLSPPLSARPIHSPSLSPPLSARPTLLFPVAAVVVPSYTVLPCRCRPVLHSPSLPPPPLSARPTQSLAACVLVPRPRRSRHSVPSARRVQQLDVLRASLSRLGASALLLQRPTQHAWVTPWCDKSNFHAQSHIHDNW